MKNVSARLDSADVFILQMNDGKPLDQLIALQ